MAAASVGFGAEDKHPVVLIVHEEHNCRDSLARLLQLSGIRVEAASSGGDAVAAARDSGFDLALVHWHLPDISGLDVGRAFKRERISVSWILMSGCLTTQAVVEAMSLGAVGVVHFPFDVEQTVLEALTRRTHQSAAWPLAVPTGRRLREGGRPPNVGPISS